MSFYRLSSYYHKPLPPPFPVAVLQKYGLKSQAYILLVEHSSTAVAIHHFLHLQVSRGLHSTGVKRMGGHGHDEPYYLHAKHMYNLDRMKYQKLKVTLGVLSVVGIGVGVPVYAVIFQQKKTASA